MGPGPSYCPRCQKESRAVNYTSKPHGEGTAITDVTYACPDHGEWGIGRNDRPEFLADRLPNTATVPLA